MACLDTVFVGLDYRWFCLIGCFAQHNQEEWLKSLSSEEVHCICTVPNVTCPGLNAWIQPRHIIILPKMCASGMSLSSSHSRPEDLVLEWLTKSPKCHMFILFVFCPPQYSWL